MCTRKDLSIYSRCWADLKQHQLGHWIGKEEGFWQAAAMWVDSGATFCFQIGTGKRKREMMLSPPWVMSPRPVVRRRHTKAFFLLLLAQHIST